MNSLKLGLKNIVAIELIINKLDFADFQENLLLSINNNKLLSEAVSAVLSFKLLNNINEKDLKSFKLEQFVEFCNRNDIFITMIESDNEIIRQQAKDLKIPVLNFSEKQEIGKKEVETKQQKLSEIPETTIITQSVRGGQQIIAKGNLIVLGSVNEGAEVLAGNDIHIYGALKGKAFAGMHGNDKACIFCSLFNAQIVSIAGKFKILEDLHLSDFWKKQVYIKINNNSFEIKEF